MCNENRDCRCIGEILRVINILQKKADIREDELGACDKGFLGENACAEFNTRPIQLFLGDNNGDDPLKMPTTRGPITPSTCFSNVFRVEKVDECCCTCRVLKQAKRDADAVMTEEKEECPKFVATNSFFTIDLHCVCSIRCLNDTFVECL